MFAKWYDTPLGQRIYAAQSRWLQTVLPQTFGYYLLQIGSTSQCAWLQPSPIQCRIGLETDATSFTANHHIARVAASYHALPFAADSIDAVVMANVLACCEHPKALLADVYRCLMPEGKLFILGFNQPSLFKHDKNHTLFSKSGYLKPSQLREQLVDLSYAVDPTHSLIQHPLMRASCLSNKLSRLGKRLWPDRAGCYAMVATKVVEILTPIRPGRQRNKKVRLKTWAGTQASVSNHKK